MAFETKMESLLNWIASLVIVGLCILYLHRDSLSEQTDFPQRIFQTWKSKTEIPANMKYWSQTWKTYHPSYTYELWDDSDNRAFVEKEFPWFLKTYDSYDREIKRADAIRYMYLYKYGGIYADMDFECLKSLEPVLKEKAQSCDILLGSMKTCFGYHQHSLPNAIMISKPGQDFWLTLLHSMEIAALDTTKLVDEMTGPVILREAYWSYWIGRSRIHIMPAFVFYPISWVTEPLDRRKALQQSFKDLPQLTQSIRKTYPDSYAATYWTHSW